ncbi:MAG: hypothetical protein J6T99_00630 [Oscillospiraceae bacterium]|nr:hypothetical protein [Oscillospiraceae bacterium]
MNNKSCWQRLLSLFLVILCSLLSVTGALADPVKTAMPEAVYESLFDDQTLCMTAKALRQWFISSGSNQQKRLGQYESIWNHEETILCNPYIIKTEANPEADELTVYCFSCIDAYSLYGNDSIRWLVKEDNEAVWLFRITFICDTGDNYYELKEVYPVTGTDEELFPGAGLASDSFPGLSEELSKSIPSDFWSTDQIARKYAASCNIDAEIINWADLPD